MSSKLFWLLLVMMLLVPTGYVLVTGLISVLFYMIGEDDDVQDEEEVDGGKEGGVEG